MKSMLAWEMVARITRCINKSPVIANWEKAAGLFAFGRQKTLGGFP